MGRAKERNDVVRCMNDRLDGAELIGFDERGYVCVWFGGYGFNVYDAAGDWEEAGHFTSGRMVDADDAEKAKQRMESEGYEIIG